MRSHSFFFHLDDILFYTVIAWRISKVYAVGTICFDSSEKFLESMLDKVKFALSSSNIELSISIPRLQFGEMNFKIQKDTHDQKLMFRIKQLSFNCR